MEEEKKSPDVALRDCKKDVFDRTYPVQGDEGTYSNRPLGRGKACFNCGKVGHLIAQCRKEVAGRGRGRGNFRKIVKDQTKNQEANGDKVMQASNAGTKRKRDLTEEEEQEEERSAKRKQ